jgi:hypothetical protein
MDLGFFESSRLRFWLWVSVPAVVVIAVTVASVAWLRQARQGLEERQALLADLPLLEVQVRKADALLKSVTPSAAQSALATEAVSRRLDQIAKNAGLTVRSVKFGESGEAFAGLVTLKVSVQIQGPLRAVVQWLDEIQKPGVLLGVGQAELTALSRPPDDTFTGDVALVVYLRSI